MAWPKENLVRDFAVSSPKGKVLVWCEQWEAAPMWGCWRVLAQELTSKNGLADGLQQALPAVVPPISDASAARS